MNLWSWLFGGFDTSDDDSPKVNPANGLPMMNESIDVEGNPYGSDLSSSDNALSTNTDWMNTSSTFDHDFGGSSSSFGDSDW